MLRLANHSFIIHLLLLMYQHASIGCRGIALIPGYNQFAIQLDEGTALDWIAYTPQKQIQRLHKSRA